MPSNRFFKLSAIALVLIVSGLAAGVATSLLATDSGGPTPAAAPNGILSQPPITPMFPGDGPCASGQDFCCLDDWQGGLCPGQRLASCCVQGSGCNNCGTFFCVTEPPICFH